MSCHETGRRFRKKRWDFHALPRGNLSWLRLKALWNVWIDYAPTRPSICFTGSFNHNLNCLKVNYNVPSRPVGFPFTTRNDDSIIFLKCRICYFSSSGWRRRSRRRRTGSRVLCYWRALLLSHPSPPCCFSLYFIIFPREWRAPGSPTNISARRSSTAKPKASLRRPRRRRSPSSFFFF